MNPNGLEQILQSYYENRLSHAFLIETNCQEQCFDDLKMVLCEINCESEFHLHCTSCNLCHLIKNESLPSLYVIRPEGQNVRKNQMLEMKQKFSTKPIYSKYNMYVILNAEKMNTSSANMILKFLEEPEDQILGFFITNNKENIIDTIKSRCQIFSCFYENLECKEDTIETLAIQLLKVIHVDREDGLLKNRDYINEKLSKDDFHKVLEYIIDIYFQFLEAKFKNDIVLEQYSEIQFLRKKSFEYLLQQINLVCDLEKQLKFNVNLNLLLDRFVLETR